MLLGNTRSYGGVIDIASAAIADDGLLDAYVFDGSGPRWLLPTAARLAARRLEGAPGVTFERVQLLEVETPGLPVQADGEYIGETPMRFSIVRQALKVLLPAGKGLHLLSQA
jgi:diacylglycerol kinase family enzyme